MGVDDSRMQRIGRVVTLDEVVRFGRPGGIERKMMGQRYISPIIYARDKVSGTRQEQTRTLLI